MNLMNLALMTNCHLHVLFCPANIVGCTMLWSHKTSKILLKIDEVQLLNDQFLPDGFVFHRRKIYMVGRNSVLHFKNPKTCT